MRTASRKILSILSMLLSTAALADELPYTLTDDLSSLSSSTSQWMTDQAPIVRLQPPYRTPETSSLGDMTMPIIELELELENASTLKQISKLRALSLLTLADKGKFQFFLGVNDDGLPGLHITLLPRNDDDRTLEVFRMPYLREDQSDDKLLRDDIESN